MKLFTPKPLVAKFIERIPQVKYFWQIDEQQGRTVAYLPNLRDESEEYVRFFLNAQELLEVCQELLARAEGGQANSPCHTGICTMVECAQCQRVIRAREVIARVTGKVHPHLQLTRDQLVAMLGDPNEISETTSKHKHPRCYKYGEIEYHFDNTGRVCLIYTESGPERTPQTIAKC